MKRYIKCSSDTHKLYYFLDSEGQLFVSDLEFEPVTRDWNNDNDVYTCVVTYIKGPFTESNLYTYSSRRIAVERDDMYDFKRISYDEAYELVYNWVCKRIGYSGNETRIWTYRDTHGVTIPMRASGLIDGKENIEKYISDSVDYILNKWW